jgi:hypothetical protein
VCTTSLPSAASSPRSSRLAAVCTTSPPIAAAVVLSLLVELELGDRRADIGRAAARARRGLHLSPHQARWRPACTRPGVHQIADPPLLALCTNAYGLVDSPGLSGAQSTTT